MTQHTPLDRVAQLYQKAKAWIFYICVTMIVLLSYFGDYLGPTKEILLPAAIVSVIVITFETLQRLETSLQEAYQRDVPVFTSVQEALPTLSNYVRHDKEVTRIDIIAATGGTTVGSLIPSILNSSGASRVEITIHLMNPDSPSMTHCPAHWRNEATTILERIEHQLRHDRIRVRVHCYDNLPVIHGVVINQQHLLLGFFGWKKDMFGINQFGGSLRPHRLYNRTSNDAMFFFELFEDWLENNYMSKLRYEFPNVPK